MSPSRRLLAPVLAVSLVATGAPALAQASPSPARPQHPTTEEIRAELQAVCRKLTEGGNLFFGHARRRQLESMLAQADEASVPAERTIGVRGAYAGELFRLGEVARAIEVLEGMRADVTEAMKQAEPQLEPSILSLLGAETSTHSPTSTRRASSSRTRAGSVRGSQPSRSTRPPSSSASARPSSSSLSTGSRYE
jgi:hypothetical protein